MKPDNRITVLIDIDGVINDLPERWVDWLNKAHGLNKRYEDIRYYIMQHNYQQELAKGTLTLDAIYAPLHDKEFWKTVSFRKDAIEYINRLTMDRTIRVVICTSSLLENAKMKWEQLSEAIPALTSKDLIVCNDKSLARGDILIEDCRENAESFKGLSILFHAPYNGRFWLLDEARNVTVAFSWDDIYNAVIEACDTVRLLKAIS